MRPGIAPQMNPLPIHKDRLFIVVLSITIVVAIAMMLRSPIVWQDEVQIVDWMRSFMQPATDWAVTHYPDGSPTVRLSPWGFAYLAVVLWPAGISLVYVRAMSILSGMLLGLSFFYLLRVKGIVPRWGAWFGLALACDTVFAQSIRGCRLDATACAAVLLALAFWVRALREDKWRTFGCVAGILTVLAVFIWPTVVIFTAGFIALLPAAWRENHASAKRVLFAGTAGGLLCGLATLCILVWIYGLNWLLEGLQQMSQDGGRIELGTTQALTLLRHVLTDPAVILLVLIVMFILARGSRGAGAIVLPVLASMAVCVVLPPFYIHRFVYVIPWIYLALIKGLQRMNWSLSFWSRAVALAMISYSVVGRLAVTLPTWSARDHSRFRVQLSESIPAGASVYSTSFAPYYVALERGWKFFVVTSRGTPDVSLVKRFEYVIAQTSLPQDFPKGLDGRHFRLEREINLTQLFLGRPEGYRVAIYRRVQS